jgi:hypothetical protein
MVFRLCDTWICIWKYHKSGRFFSYWDDPRIQDFHVLHDVGATHAIDRPCRQESLITGYDTQYGGNWDTTLPPLVKFAKPFRVQRVGLGTKQPRCHGVATPILSPRLPPELRVRSERDGGVGYASGLNCVDR